MIVKISLGKNPVQLADPSDCTRFHVRCATSIGPDEAAEFLLRANAGRAAIGDDVQIAVSWIRAQSGLEGTTHWEKDFAAMLDFADKRGWLTPDGNYVLAHFERDR